MTRRAAALAALIGALASAPAAGAQAAAGRSCSLADIAAALGDEGLAAPGGRDRAACRPAMLIAVFAPDSSARAAPAYAAGGRSVLVFEVAPTAAAASPRADDAAEMLTRVHEDIIVGDLQASRGDYARAIGLFTEARDDLAVLARRYPRARLLQEHRRELARAIARTRAACAAETAVQRRRGGTPPRCS